MTAFQKVEIAKYQHCALPLEIGVSFAISNKNTALYFNHFFDLRLSYLGILQY